MSEKIPGPKSRAVREREDRLLAPGLQRFAILAGIVVESGRGSRVTDIDGNTFIDIIGGIGVNGLGHSHPKFVAAIQAQVEKASVGSFTSEPRVRFFERLAKYHPEAGGYRIQLYSGGAEAVESAFRLCKSFTGKHEFVSFWGGFHGKTAGTLALMGSSFKDGYGPFVPGCHVVSYANCYRCPLKMKYPSCDLACADVAKEEIKKQSQGKVAAIIVEPMQGTAGNVIPPDEWLPRIKEIAQELGALFIADEMISGFGRTGKFWGVDHTGVKPDIITLGKQFGGGYPVSAVLARHDIAQAKPWSNPSGSSSSYGGNPLASAAVEAALRIIEEENLVENSRKMGEYFLAKLKPFEERYPFVGEVRGRGLFLGMELVKDKITKEPLPKEKTQHIFNECLQRGLLTMAYAANFRLQPSMTIDEATIDEAVDILTEVFDGISV